MADWLVHQELERQATWHPSNRAIWFEGDEWTYREFNRRVNQIARYLKDHGIEQGDAVIAHGKNHPDLYAIFFACSKVGAVYSPVSTYQSETNIAYICDRLSPKIVFHTADDEIGAETLPTFQSALPTTPFVCLDPTDNAKEPSLTAQLSEYDSTNPSWAREPSQTTHHNIFWTSGTTGQPKGVVRSHQPTLHFSDPLMEQLPFEASSRRLIHNDMMFVAPYLSEGVPTIMTGGTFYILRSFSPGKVVDAIQAHDITDIHISFTKTQLLYDYLQEQDISIRIPRVQAALPNAEVAGRLIEIAGSLYHSYATTESGRPVATEVTPPFEDRPPLGTPGRSADVRLVTPNDRIQPPDQPPQPGDSGEIAIRGDITLTRYLRDENQAGLVQNGWVYPGDMAHVNQDGQLVFMGRVDDQLRTGGINVYPMEIEQVLADHPDVSKAVVVGVDDEKWGDRICCVVVTDRGDTDTFADELDAFLRENDEIRDQIRPKSYGFVGSTDELPTSAVNKIDKPAVRSLFE